MFLLPKVQDLSSKRFKRMQTGKNKIEKKREMFKIMAVKHFILFAKSTRGTFVLYVFDQFRLEQLFFFFFFGLVFCLNNRGDASSHVLELSRRTGPTKTRPVNERPLLYRKSENEQCV